MMFLRLMHRNFEIMLFFKETGDFNTLNYDFFFNNNSKKITTTYFYILPYLLRFCKQGLTKLETNDINGWRNWRRFVELPLAGVDKKLFQHLKGNQVSSRVLH